MVKRGDMMDIDDILEILSIELLGIIPDDEKIIISTNKGEPVVMDEKSRAGQEYRNIARRILGENIPIVNEEENLGFLSRLKKLFGLNNS